MGILTKAQILAATDLKSEQVAVPEWGGDVLVRMMTGAERDAFEASLASTNKDGKRGNGLANMRARLVAMTAVDESGSLLFSESDIDLLGKKSAAALERVFSASLRLNKMTDDSAKEVEKN